MAHFPQTPAFTGFNTPSRVEGDIVNLAHQGAIPAELNGAFYRVQPDPQFPPRLGGAKPVNAANVQRLAEVHEFGMEPHVIAARVLEAMREDRFHIFTHPEFRDELRELFHEILQDFRDYPADAGHDKRIDFEKMRRESYRKQRRGLKAT